MSVHYKFKSALEYDTVTFDGLHISVKDLKNAIIQQKRIGKSTDFDLQVTNAQTKEVYQDENVLIPKNTSLLIARIPTSAQTKTKQWEGYGGDSTPPTKLDEGGPIAKAVDLSSLDAPEDDKIKAMMSQSTQDYDPSNYMKIRGANQMGAVPPNYRCYKCHQTGHWIKDCPLSKGPEPIEIKKSTGIPLSFMVPVEGPQVQGAMMTPNGSYAVPVLDHQTYTQKQTAPPPAPIQEMRPEIPEDLVCSICSDLLTDAVMIPCCGNSFCDECIRSFLLESEEHECPDCHEKDISPATLIPNRFLRNSVANFKNTTGYVKKLVYKQCVTRIEGNVEVKVKEAPPLQESTKVEVEEKTVISEADSTEHSKNEEEKEINAKPSSNTEQESLPEGPPGVSPAESPKTQSITKRVNSSRERSNTSRQHKHRSSREESPRRHHRSHRASPYRDSSREERAGTPTVDEPGATPSSNYPPPEVRSYNAPPMMGMVPPMQGPPPSLPPNYANPPAPMGNFPPTNGPPPNFRLPPPGTAPPYMAPGPYQVPPRPIFDTSRPPMSGPPPMYNASYQGSRSHHREYGMSDRRMRGRTPSGVIDDPLAAFNRMLREKDERERRAKRQRRSYSRSRSRSRSYSRSPRRMRSRSPRRRQSRSRSRSFSISRSRSRSFSGSLRGTPFRDFSPRHASPRRRGPSRYRSPIRSPPRHRFKDSHQFRDRDYDHERDREREFVREERGYSREREHRGREDRETHHDRDRDRDYGYYDSYDDRSRGKGGWGQPRGPLPPQADAYYQPEMQHPYPPPANRYPPRDYPPSSYNKELHVMPPAVMAARRYDDVAPPGVEEPPVPGLENTRFEERFDRFPSPIREEKREDAKEKRKHERSRSPEKKEDRRKSKSKDKESPEKHKKKKKDASPDRDKKVHSDEEKSKKSKDRKKKKEKKDSDKKKRKEKKEKHKEKKHKEEVKEEEKEKVKEEENQERSRSPDAVEERKEEQMQDLYDDMLSEGVDTNVMENYGKIKEASEERTESFEEKLPEKTLDEAEFQKEYEDSEKDILEIHPTDIDLKTDLDVKNEMLAHLPEKSKWEVEEDVTLHLQTSPNELGRAEKSDKSGKVTNEVLKRAENAIFAKAINAIRPIEIKKISMDRAKLYSGEKEDGEKDDEVEIKSFLNNEEKSERKRIEAPLNQPPVRLSVKERLGIKIDDIDRIVKVDRNKSRSISPFTRRVNETSRNYGLGERRVEVVDKSRRRERSHHRERSSRHDFRREDFSRRDRRDRPDARRRDERKRERSKSKPRVHHEEEKKEKEKRKRSRSRSRTNSEERKEKRKRKEKKVKKEKVKKHKEDDEEKKEETKIEEVKIKNLAEKRKPTIDEANFEPDYDLESESEKEDKKEKKVEEKKSSSSSDSSDSSSDDDKKRKKHKKHRKKKSRKDSSSSSSESESESSDEDKDRKRKKHKKKQKKKKKSKHK